MPSPNAEHIAVWNDIIFPKILRFRHVFVIGAAKHSDAALARHPVRQGERVLDVGCGFGETSIRLAQLVGPTGSVVGTDCIEGALAIGHKDAERAGVANVTFRCADAQSEAFEPRFDLVFARFGTMFFSNPVAAMRNLRGALVPGGRLLMCTWRVIEDNPWLFVPKSIARKHLPPPADTAPTCGPGPFSMADRDTVTSILGSAGFSDIAFDRIDAEILVGPTVDEAIEFQLQLGPAGEVVREAGPLGVERRPAIVAELRAALAPYQREGGIFMPSSSWAITARSV